MRGTLVVSLDTGFIPEWEQMQIDKGAAVAIAVNRSWANLHGVRMFLRRGDNPQREVRGVDDSHVIFARVLDAGDAQGVWIELAPDKTGKDPAMLPFKLLIPWSQVLTIVLADQFSPAIRDEARKIGFTGETESG